MASNESEPQARGGCLCGAVRHEVRGELHDMVNCHRRQCRRNHGHFSPYTSVAKNDPVFLEAPSLKWVSSSEHARRGFCGECGTPPEDGKQRTEAIQSSIFSPQLSEAVWIGPQVAVAVS